MKQKQANHPTTTAILTTKDKRIIKVEREMECQRKGKKNKRRPKERKTIIRGEKRGELIQIMN